MPVRLGNPLFSGETVTQALLYMFSDSSCSFVFFKTPHSPFFIITHNVSFLPNDSQSLKTRDWDERDG